MKTSAASYSPPGWTNYTFGIWTPWWQTGADLPAGTYRLTFETGAYLEQSGAPAFFPSVTVTLATAATEPHYHVPLLLSPFAYSTYRGS